MNTDYNYFITQLLIFNILFIEIRDMWELYKFIDKTYNEF